MVPANHHTAHDIPPAESKRCVARLPVRLQRFSVAAHCVLCRASFTPTSHLGKLVALTPQLQVYTRPPPLTTSFPDVSVSRSSDCPVLPRTQASLARRCIAPELPFPDTPQTLDKRFLRKWPVSFFF